MPHFGLYKQRPRPGWVDFMDDAAWTSFIEHLKASLKGRGLDFTITDETVEIRRPLKRRMGLQNLAQLCATSPQSGWPELIGEFLDASTQGLPLPPDSQWDDVKGLIKVRLVMDDSGSEESDMDASGALAPGISWSLVYDLPDVIQFVRSDRPAAWSMALPDLLIHACKNVREQDPPERVRRHPLEGGGEFVSLDGPSHFVATHAMWIPEYVPEATDSGLLLAVPDRNNVLAAAILDQKTSQVALGRLLKAARKFYQMGPGSISPHVYWRTEQAWTLLSVGQERDGVIEYTPPPDFVEMFNRLPMERN
jgi:hypothetical protein